jgi:protein-S-isoprenylcysteine O-methyltransferase Ste14
MGTVLVLCLVAGLLLLTAAWLIFGVLVPRDYRQRGRLAPLTGLLELIAWLLFVGFPFIYNPVDWWLVCFATTPGNLWQKIAGSALVLGGMGLAVGAMAGLGAATSFGQRAEALQEKGLYRWSRNPQLIGGFLAVAGVAALWPSLYAVGWAAMYGIMGHWMVLAEEEHLRNLQGEGYERYCRRVSPYFGFPRRDR